MIKSVSFLVAISVLFVVSSASVAATRQQTLFKNINNLTVSMTNSSKVKMSLLKVS
jgi:hypothetical protein